MDQDHTLGGEMKKCRKANLKLHIDNYHFRCISTPPLFGEIVSRHGIQPDTSKLNMLVEMPPKSKKVAFFLVFRKEELSEQRLTSHI